MPDPGLVAQMLLLLLMTMLLLHTRQTLKEID
jgi:hypothetical protein